MVVVRLFCFPVVFLERPHKYCLLWGFLLVPSPTKTMEMYMPTETIAVPPIGGDTGAKTTPSATPPEGIDYLTAIATLEDENKRLTTERENYRGAYLKASSKLKDKNIAPDEQATYDDERLNRAIDARLADSQLMANQQKMTDLVKKMARENQELKVAATNKAPQTSTTTSGTSMLVPDTNRGISPETLELFKKRGWTDKMIEKFKENLKKPLGQ